MKKKIFLIGNLITIQSLFSQTNNILPPSPESAQIAKYIETPVAYTNGIPEIGIPLFNLKDNDINIPVSLNYHAGGFKVEEIASEVGLGWSLNVGGQISRVMRDKPDDFSTKGFLYNDLSSLSTSAYSKIVNEKIDVEADTFVFSFFNYSGKFSYNQSTHTFIQFPLSDIKIEPIYQNQALFGFVITTPDGFKYYFGYNRDKTRHAVNTYEECISYFQNKNLDITPSNEDISYINTWHLTEIVSPGNNSVSLFYEDIFPSEQLIRSTQSISYSSTKPELKDLYPVTSYQVPKGTSTHLKKIQLKTGSLEIEYSDTAREDLKYAKSIKEVKLVNLNTDYTSYVFQQSYFVSPSINNSFINSFGDHYTKRLKLDGVSLKNSKNNIITTNGNYLFTYSNLTLPNRFSFDQDYWGYYNGAGNSSLIPDYYIGTEIVKPVTGSATRAVNPNFTGAGMLKKIQYPTGGTTEYYYESNIAGNIGFKDNNRPNNLRNYTEDKILNFVKSNTYSTGYDTYEATFTINNVLGETNINSVLPNCGSHASFDCGFIVTLKSLDNNSVNYILTTQNTFHNLPNGNYKITAQDLNPSSATNDFTVTIRWNQDADPNQLYTGGLRIKEIVSDDLRGGSIIKKYYYEGDEIIPNTNELLSSGIAVSAPVLHTDAVKGADIYDKISSSSNLPTINIGKNEMHYTKVTEVIADKIKTEYYFDTVGDLSNNIGEIGETYCDFAGSGGASGGYITELFKNRMEPLFTDRRGKLLMRKDYRFNDINNTFSLSRKETNTYIESRNYSMPSNAVKYEIGSSYDGNCIPMRYYFYPQRTNFTYLSKNTVEVVLNNSIVTETEYFYNNASHHQLTSQKNQFPDLSIHTTSYSYAHEKGNQKLIDANMIGIPLETTTTQTIGSSTKTLSKTETVYPTSVPTTQAGNLLLPLSVKSYDLQNSATTYTEVTYDQYDSRGNLQQYTTKDGVPVAIVWGYNQTQPIAKIEGATYAQINSLASAIIAASDTDASASINNDESALLAALDSFRNNTALSGYQVSTYTYDPLIGVRSITPPSGIREYYIYDSANRLEKVVDSNGNILKEYKYNYKQ
ncbi:RHS repeat domain-containing protein [Chryseobacterium sp. CT-SW4]|uniref:hypothetical protein n=1 Tax=Chryseobacterium sp. SW-1 TaxID=3157343 RepID=UPI003B02E520